ncbi:MFS transporter [Catenulispora subtropica]
MGMFPLSTAVLATGLHRSYALVGLGGAMAWITIAAGGPRQARLVDRYGQAKVAVPAALLAAVGAAGLLTVLYTDGPSWLYLVACAGSALGPNTGSLARARWAYLHKGDEAALHTAYAYEGVVDELGFVLGPVIAMGLIAASSATVAFVTAALLQLGGILLLATRRDTEPPAAGPTVARTADDSLRIRALGPLILMLCATGVVFGTTEITTMGFAASHGDKGSAGAVVSCYALGSLLSGLAFGLWRPRGSAVVRVRWALAAMALTLAPLMVAHTLPTVAAVLFVAGFATAPVISTSIGLVGQLVPESRMTEGFTWTTTGLVLGISMGSACGGWMVDHFAAGTGYQLPSLAALLALVLSVAVRPAAYQKAVTVP